MYRILVVETSEYLYRLRFDIAILSAILYTQYELNHKMSRFKSCVKVYEAESLREAKNMLRLTLASTDLILSPSLVIKKLPLKNFKQSFSQIESIFEFVKI